MWRAWTEPELVKRWWGGQRGEVTSAEIDLRVGGTWRYVMSAHGGFEVAFHGEYREIVPNERLVSTEVYEGMPDGGARSTPLTLSEQRRAHHADDRWSSTPSREHRDAHLDSGMEGGMQEAMDLLEQVAVALA